MADYLMPNQTLIIEDQIEIFQLRSRRNKLPSNWGEDKPCETGCGLILNNDHILNCFLLNESESEKYDLNLIYNGNIEEKIRILNIFRRNSIRRKKYLPQDS